MSGYWNGWMSSSSPGLSSWNGLGYLSRRQVGNGIDVPGQIAHGSYFLDVIGGKRRPRYILATWLRSCLYNFCVEGGAGAYWEGDLLMNHWYLPYHPLTWFQQPPHFDDWLISPGPYILVTCLNDPPDWTLIVCSWLSDRMSRAMILHVPHHQSLFLHKGRFCLMGVLMAFLGESGTGPKDPG